MTSAAASPSEAAGGRRQRASAAPRQRKRGRDASAASVTPAAAIGYSAENAVTSVGDDAATAQSMSA